MGAVRRGVRGWVTTGCKSSTPVAAWPSRTPLLRGLRVHDHICNMTASLCQTSGRPAFLGPQIQVLWILTMTTHLAESRRSDFIYLVCYLLAPLPKEEKKCLVKRRVWVAGWICTGDDPADRLPLPGISRQSGPLGGDPFTCVSPGNGRKKSHSSPVSCTL